jgi:hypothetical protein
MSAHICASHALFYTFLYYQDSHFVLIAATNAALGVIIFPRVHEIALE